MLMRIFELMEICPGPDFPTGATIHGTRGIREAYAGGRGTVHVRAKAHTEERGKDRESLIVSEK